MYCITAKRKRNRERKLCKMSLAQANVVVVEEEELSSTELTMNKRIFHNT